MNPFETQSENDIEHLFDTAATDILINNQPFKGIITNINLTNETEDRNLHTLERVTQGDVITYQHEDYLCIVETITKRHAKYKSLIRHCNYNLELPGEQEKEFIGYDDNGEPQYKIIEGEPTLFPAIVSDKTFSIDERYAVRVANNQIYVFTSDTKEIREGYQLNKVFNVMHNNYKVIHHDYTQRGLIIMLCESTSEEVN